jgi:uncharacterized damage-inducible protein DinB/heme-degrading monooxygenase HmoA
MIARVWDGATDSRHRDDYTDYLRRTGVTDLQNTEGNKGVYVLRREDGRGTGFRMISLWESMDAIRRFSGPDPEKARYYPEDESFLLHMSPGVEHYEVVVGPCPDSSTVEAEALADELCRVWSGNAWHGPSLTEALEGLTAAEAARRPFANAHTIWELVHHITAWTDTVARRLDGEPLDEPEVGDFPTVDATTPMAWSESLARLEAAHQRLTERVVRLTGTELEATVPLRAHTARLMVDGAIGHVVYHTGQIMLLRKAADSTAYLDSPAAPTSPRLPRGRP